MAAKKFNPTPTEDIETEDGKKSKILEDKKNLEEFGRDSFYQKVSMNKDIFSVFPELRQTKEFVNYKPYDDICMILRYFCMIYHPESPLIPKYQDFEELKQKAASCIGFNYKTDRKPLWEFVNDITNEKAIKLILAFYAFMGKPMHKILFRKLAMYRGISQRNNEMVYSKKLKGDDKDLVETQIKVINLMRAEFELLTELGKELSVLRKDTPVIADIVDGNLDIVTELIEKYNNLSMEYMEKTKQKQDENT